MRDPDTAAADSLLALVKLGMKVNLLFRCDVLASAKRAYLRLHPETGHGYHRRHLKGATRPGPPAFATYAAAKTGRSLSSIKRDITIWERLTPDSRDRLCGTDHSSKLGSLQLIAGLPADRQGAALDQLLSGPAQRTRRPKLKASCQVDLTHVPSRDLLAELLRREGDGRTAASNG